MLLFDVIIVKMKGIAGHVIDLDAKKKFTQIEFYSPQKCLLPNVVFPQIDQGIGCKMAAKPSEIDNTSCVCL